ncbi:MAG: AAA family ATPase [Acidimicrobiia bacterium]
MVDLVFLNGPPAGGKSTIAAELVAHRPLALKLDVDVVRGLLGRWLDQPAEAGRAARRLALSMARTHLDAGFDVVVPQFVAREDFVLDLADVARACGARFVELALVVDPAVGVARFSARRGSSDPTHRDAQALVDQAGLPSVATVYDDYERFVATRPDALRVEIVDGDVAESARRVERALAADR